MKSVKLSSKFVGRNALLCMLLWILIVACSTSGRKTTVSISGDRFYINGALTYAGREWKGNKIEGLLFNSRMVQGIFDDLNPETRERFKYPDTNIWDPDRNTNEFVASMEEWYKAGLLAFTLNLQGGSPLGYGNNGWINSAFDSTGGLRPEYMGRLDRILHKADELGMVVILGYFYFGQDQHLKDEASILRGVDNITNWIIDSGYKNILIEINNECNVRYDHEILQPHRVHELIDRVKNMQYGDSRLLVSTSYGGGFLPLPNVVSTADFILLHGNGMHEPSSIARLVESTRNVEGYTPKPILFNEDDHFNFEADSCNFVSAVRAYASWGYFDYRMKDEGYESGYQSVPVDWGINSDRKKGFFRKLSEITTQ
ncbi:MAG: hypothetical protein OEV74_09295 [Cyclobacteriaceae bacterium]|nr:hypothetical protein [Cyclobacteriaceae bacterium]MDH4296462.1 hypothetical protein [Cyclobacteriaceae bacterium]MDH5250098.1 hypothetical protein [Cyclobacteriaceae bacterium]